MKQISKVEIIKKIDFDYFSKVTLAQNNCPRYEFLSKSNKEMIDYYSNKYNRKQVVEIWKSFVIGESPSDVASRLKEKSGKDLATVFAMNLPEKYRPEKEFRVGNRFCDLVFLDNEGLINAIEVKANGDIIASAIEQTRDYSVWANKVWLLIEEKKLKKAKRINLPQYVGIIVFQNKKFHVDRDAEIIEHDSVDYLNIMSVSGLKFLAKLFRVKMTGTKKEIKDRLLKEMKRPRLTDIPTCLRNTQEAFLYH